MDNVKDMAFLEFWISLHNVFGPLTQDQCNFSANSDYIGEAFLALFTGGVLSEWIILADEHIVAPAITIVVSAYSTAWTQLILHMIH